MWQDIEYITLRYVTLHVINSKHSSKSANKHVIAYKQWSWLENNWASSVDCRWFRCISITHMMSWSRQWQTDTNKQTDRETEAQWHTDGRCQRATVGGRTPLTCLISADCTHCACLAAAARHRHIVDAKCDASIVTGRGSVVHRLTVTRNNCFHIYVYLREL